MISKAYSQELNYVDFTNASGLPFPEIQLFAMVYDSTYIIINSDNEVYKFDGYDFEDLNFKPNYELTYIHNYVDHSLFTNWNRLIVYKNETFSTVDNPPQIDNNLKITSFRLVNEEIYIGYEQGHVAKYNGSALEYVDQIEIEGAISILYNPKGRYYTGAYDTGENFIYDSLNKRVFYKGIHDITLKGESIIAIINNEFFTWEDESFVPHTKTIVYLINENIGYSANSTNDPFIFHRTEQGDWNRLGKITKLQPRRLKKGYNNTLLAGGHSGLGLYYPHIQYYESGKNGVPNAIHTIVDWKDGEKIVGSYSEGLFHFDGNNFIKLNYIDGTNLQKTLPGGFNYGKENVLIFDELSGLVNVKIDSETLEIEKVKGDMYIGFMIDTLRDGRLVLGLYRKGFGLESRKGSMVINTSGAQQGNLLINVLCFTQDKNDRIWCGRSSQGIALCDKNGKNCHTWLRDQDNINTYGAMSMLTDKFGTIWIGTNAGLYYLKEPESIDSTSNLFDHMTPISLPDKDAGRINAMTIVDSFLVFGGNNSLNFLNLNNFYKSLNQAPIYQYIFGMELQGNGVEQNSMHFDSDRKLWIGCQTGILVIDWDNMWFDHTTNKVSIKSILCSGTEIEQSGDIIKIPVDKRNLFIRFGLDKNISMMRNVYFDYSVIKNNGDTLYSEKAGLTGSIDISYIPPGEYALKIIASKHGKEIDKLERRIVVPLSLSENPWFWGLLSSILMGGFIGFLLYRQRQRKLQFDTQLQLSTLENEKTDLLVQSIISSFNPHFINNSLHWIQSRYNKDEKLTRVIENLSKNLKTILATTQSGKAYHTLKDELEFVKKYTEIQQVRFPSINFILPQDVSEDCLMSDILIMQIQIHVENAVEHGINNREDGNTVKLNIENEDDYYSIIIEDNGIGRIAARDMKSNGTQQGTKMLASLHSIFNKINDLKITQVYQDEIYTGENGIKYGTRVIIRIPKHYSYIALKH